MGKYTDKELAQLVCKIYVDYYNTNYENGDILITKTINKGIKELSNMTHKTEEHLKELLEKFFSSFTSEEQIIIKTIKDKIKENKKIRILERIDGFSKTQLIDYLEIEQASVVISKLNKYINGNDEEKARKAKKISEQIREIVKEKQEQQQEEFKKNKYLKIKEVLDTMVNNGFFSVSHFSIEFHNKYGVSDASFRNQIKCYIEYLRANYQQEYNRYQFLIEQNKWKSYEKNRNEIEKIISSPEKYDIVDYYMHINLPTKTFLRLCEYMLDEKDYSKIKIFINKYFDQPGFIPKNEPWIATQNHIINGVTLTPETQELILKFMEENNIPSNFFISCYTKYINNELDLEKQNVKSL